MDWTRALNELGDQVEDDLRNFDKISLDRSLNYLFMFLLCISMLALVVSMNNTSKVIDQLPELSTNNARILCGFTGNFTWAMENRNWAKIINRSGGWNWTINSSKT